MDERRVNCEPELTWQPTDGMAAVQSGVDGLGAGIRIRIRLDQAEVGDDPKRRDERQELQDGQE